MHIAMALLTGLVVGGATVLALIVSAVERIVIYNERGWRTARDIGNARADPLTKAVISKIGLFANSSEEALYFDAVHPHDRSVHWGRVLAGRPFRPLTAGGHFRIEGNLHSLPCAWWSVTLYGQDDFLFDAAGGRHSYTDFNVQAAEDGTFVIDVAPSQPERAVNWLPAPADKPFVITLRIYQPDPKLYSELSTTPLPRFYEVDSQ